jgi:hypothetical protein
MHAPPGTKGDSNKGLFDTVRPILDNVTYTGLYIIGM